MTKKDYVVIAGAIFNTRPGPFATEGVVAQYNATIEVMANTLAIFNPRFDRGIFITACGGFRSYP